MHEHACSFLKRLPSVCQDAAMKAAKLAVTLVLVALVATACTASAGAPDLALFDVAGDDLATPIGERAPAPAGALPAFVVRSYADPGAFDEILAQAEAVARDDQVIVTADLSGCVLLTLWAQPAPERVLVGFEFDGSITCAQAVNYRALFIIDEVGTNPTGAWDYTDAPPTITLENQSGS